MTIEWNKVTWYSKIVAIVLFVGVFYLGYWFGKQNTDTVYIEVYRSAKQPNAISQSISSIGNKEMATDEIVANAPTRFTVGNFLDLALVVSERGSDCGGGDTCHDFIKMYANLDLDSENVVGLRIDSTKGLSCVDPKIKTGDVVRVKGKIANVVEDIGIVMSCDDPETQVTKIIPSETLDNVPASILFAENEMEEMYLVIDVLSRNPDWFAELYAGPADGKDRVSFYLNKSTELRKIELTSKTKFTHCQQADGIIPSSTALYKEFAAIREEIISERVYPSWQFGVVRNISVQNGKAIEIIEICVP